MYRKWLGWKKVAVCLVGAAMVMQGASMTMAADEYPTEQNEPDYANEDQTAEDTAEGSTDSDEDSEDQSTSDEDTDEDTSDEDTLHEETDEDTSDEDSDSVADVVIDPEETPEESEDVIAAEEDGEDAESVGLLVTGTVSHIDLSRVAEATLTVGDKTLTQTVVFDEGDLGNITVDPDYAGAIILGEGQIHIAGVFPVGTFDNRVQYTVSITKDVTFTDPDTGATYTQTMTFTSSFNYWDEGNMCPSLGYREYWSNGFVIPWSGMDFGFGTASAVIPGPTAVPVEPTATPTPTPGATDPEGPTATPTPTPGATDPEGPTATPTPTPGAEETVTPTPTVAPDATETPDPTEDPDATATPTPTATGTTTGSNGGDGTSTNGTSSNGTTTSDSQKSNQVKTADNTKVAGSAFMFAFALLDVVLAFFALHLKHRRDK
ncbi:hypothetical protein [Blautia obeum]|uniref:hypothetical protein n=4 Tax=Blautia TaxID=572511 RepID=UPI003566AE49